MNVVHVSLPDRHERREARAEAMLDAAQEILAREGIAAVTVQRVAQAPGYVPAAMYRYFSSKDALVAALQRRTIGALHRALTERRAAWAERAVKLSAGESALLELLGAVWFYLNLERELPGDYAVIAALLGDARPLLDDREAVKAAPALLGLLGDVRASLERAQGAGVLGDGDAMARALALWACAQGASVLSKLARVAQTEGPADADARSLGMFCATSLLRGWGADEHTLRRAEAALRDETGTVDAKREGRGAAKKGRATKSRRGASRAEGA